MIMETTGQKILEIRKRKGLSQEALSKLAKINLRTLQRIEKDETKPLGNTLISLCTVLEINIGDILDNNKKEDKMFLVLFHLSALSFIFIRFGNIFIPMILWLTKRDKIRDLNKQGATLLIFQIIWTLLLSASIMAYAFMFIQHSEYKSAPLFIAGALILTNIVYTIITSISISKKRV
jgi:transcriptional regulator with XRE-family HTH domain